MFKKTETWSLGKQLIIFGGSAIGLWIIALVIVSCIGGQKAGPFGDGFGALNALFTGLAFVGVAIAAWFQKDQLQLAKTALKEQKRLADEQLKLARTAAADQKDAADDQLLQAKDALEADQDAIKKQQFETTFFNMLHMLNEVEQGIDCQTLHMATTTGKKSFIDFCKDLSIRKPKQHCI